jgi:hypothetical protein
MKRHQKKYMNFMPRELFFIVFSFLTLLPLILHILEIFVLKSNISIGIIIGISLSTINLLFLSKIIYFLIYKNIDQIKIKIIIKIFISLIFLILLSFIIAKYSENIIIEFSIGIISPIILISILYKNS